MSTSLKSARWLQSKDDQRRIFTECGQPGPDWVLKAGPLQFAELAERLGAPLIVQRPVGSAGRTTWEACDAVALEALTRGSHGPWMISRRLAGTPVNVHVDVNETVEVSWPSLQGIGIPAVTDLPFGYCGADFGLLNNSFAAIEEVAAAVGGELRCRGWSGVFGLDLLIGRDRVVPLEINDRQQASSWLLAEAEQRAGRVPLLARNARRLGLDVGGARSFSRDDVTPAGSYVTVRARTRLPEVGCCIRDGVWSVPVRGGPQFLHPAIGLLGCSDDNVVFDGLPDPGIPIDAGAVICRVASWQRLIDNSGRRLTVLGARAVAAVHALAGDGFLNR